MKTKNIVIGIIAFAALAGGSYYYGTGLENNSSSKEGTVQGAGFKEFDIVMQNNRYNPSEITVNEGDRVVINILNQDSEAHGVSLPQFGASVPGGHVFPRQPARMEFIASRKGKADAATCGGGPFQQNDVHGEELIVNVI